MGILEGKKIAFIGGGAMAEAILSGVLNAGLTSPENLWVSDPEEARRKHFKSTFGINVTDDNSKACNQGDLVILAVKPYMIEKVLKETGTDFNPEQIVVSIAAGVSASAIEKLVAPGVPVIRVMPNTPCLVGEGASALALGSDAGPKQEALVKAVFSAVGKAVVVKEELMDAVTGLSGSGPAYMYIILEAMADGAVRMGLPRQEAITLAAQTMLGAAKMVLETGEHPGRLKDMVTTPGGTTIAGLYALEKEGVRGAIMKAVSKAAKKAGELSK